MPHTCSINSFKILKSTPCAGSTFNRGVLVWVYSKTLSGKRSHISAFQTLKWQFFCIFMKINQSTFWCGIIIDIHARQIFDSRGNPTIEVDVTTENGYVGRAAVPSGASTGEHEAVELRDGGNAYMGKGVMKAVEHVNGKIAGYAFGNFGVRSRRNRSHHDRVGWNKNKSKLGANAILGVSLAAAKSSSQWARDATISLCWWCKVQRRYQFQWWTLSMEAHIAMPHCISGIYGNAR